MKKLFLISTALAFLAMPVMADENSTGVGGGANNTGAATTGYGGEGSGTGYQHTVPRTVVWAARIARLQAAQAAGAAYYGNSKIPIANAIAKSIRQLAVYQAAEDAGNPYPAIVVNGGKDDSCGSLYGC